MADDQKDGSQGPAAPSAPPAPVRKDRRSRKPNSSVHAPAKKGGAGGSYTWGDTLDVPADYEPVGQQGPEKVTTAPPASPELPPIPTTEDVEPKPSPEAPKVEPPDVAQFPPLPETVPSKPAPVAATVHATKAAPGSAWAAKSQVRPAAGGAPASGGYLAAAWVRVLAPIVYAREAASKQIAQPLVAGFTTALAAAREAQAAALAHVVATMGAAAATYDSIKDKGVRAWALWTVQAAAGAASATAGAAKVKVADIAAGARAVASDKSFQSTAVAAAGGAVALGTSGGAAGLATGTALGAAVGLVPALFTFGLSIPIGAAIGGGAGLLFGAAAGSTVGAMGGGAAGYGAYAKREQLAGVASKTMAKVNDSAGYVTGRACASADYVKERASVVRARLVGGGTGSTEDGQRLGTA